jgi:mRNA-degrading endonuclease HigB of HigAB toxin-antitoxin module
MRKAFERFYQISKQANWRKPQDVFKTFNTADLVSCDKGSRMVFNIGSNKYRLIVGTYFGSTQTVFYVKFAGTHEEYNTVDVCRVDQFKKA